MIQLELTHENCATRERRIPELEAELALLTEEAASLRNYMKLLEEKVVRVTNLEHQAELSEHRLTQAQQRIKVNFLIIFPQNCMEYSLVIYNHCKATDSFVMGRECTRTIFVQFNHSRRDPSR
jgi:hypothetical protein